MKRKAADLPASWQLTQQPGSLIVNFPISPDHTSVKIEFHEHDNSPFTHAVFKYWQKMFKYWQKLQPCELRVLRQRTIDLIGEANNALLEQHFEPWNVLEFKCQLGLCASCERTCTFADFGSSYMHGLDSDLKLKTRIHREVGCYTIHREREGVIGDFTRSLTYMLTNERIVAGFHLRDILPEDLGEIVLEFYVGPRLRALSLF